MENSHIQWTTHTFNPWEGCSKVSAGCAHCYAEARNQRFAAGANWGPGAPRRRTSAGNWRQPIKWNDAAIERGGWERPRVFCASLADWLDDEVPIEWLADLLALIHATPNLDWLMLTKRPENFHERVRNAIPSDPAAFGWRMDWLNGHAPANVWIGATTENQECADLRIPRLLSIPARVRFLSCEPLLGPVLIPLAEYLATEVPVRVAPLMSRQPNRIHWVIAGGESGPCARQMATDWAFDLLTQCRAAGVSFFMKQMGGIRDKRGNIEDLPEDLRVREFPTAHSVEVTP